MKHIVCVLGLLAPPLHAVVAQAPLIPELGSRVRVATDRQLATGTLESVDNTRIVVRDGNGKTVEFPRAAHPDLAVSAGPGMCARRFRCVALGFLGGGLVGLGAGAAAGSGNNDAFYYLATTPLGALVGAVVGAVLPGERWKQGALPALTYVVPEASGERRIRLGLQLRF